jgi:hypothetical protein
VSVDSFRLTTLIRSKRAAQTNVSVERAALPRTSSKFVVITVL